ncbi:MAG: tyrosine-type recombinase/integrase [[Clostridium] aminophilum]|uniref:tyrosine-type recombinase/integrase n=1 Tax=[Clostridium] aminophilum TaxID=1526 RepID=UPI0026F17BF4|nr:tyrosine-type recombinase/integrase [[Clostridium] aminophilum]MDD6196657.1 tyrosine-type recombinase/integrase [[Clostridium] aminophilum]
MRRELKQRIIELVSQTAPEVSELQDLGMRLDIILGDYEITQRSTALAVVNEVKNEAIMRKFLSAKIARGLSKRTIKFYGDSLRSILRRIGKDYDQITADDIRLYLALRVNRDRVSKTTANNERRNLSAFYGWLQNEEILLRNPMAKVDNIKQHKEKKKAFTELDVEKMRVNLRTNREAAIFETLLSTWCRVSELAQIRIDEINGEVITVHGKGDKDRDVYLNAKAQIAIDRYLEERKDSNPYLFPKSCYDMKSRKGISTKDMKNWYRYPRFVTLNEHSDASNIETTIRKLGIRSGVENAHPHRFRRTGATWALRQGMELMQVSKLLGHESIATTQIYLDISDDELMQAHRRFVN